MKRLILILLGVGLLTGGSCASLGCMISTKVKGRTEAGLRFGTSMSWYTQSSATADEASTAESKVTLDDRIIGPAKREADDVVIP